MASKVKENEILLLLEGDISDIEEFDDIPEENDIGYDAPEVEDVDVLDIGLDLEVNTDEDWDSEDDEPLAKLTSISTNREEVLWKKTSFREVNPDFTFGLKAPDEILTPLDYFKKFISDNIIENIVLQTNLYSMQESGSSINTNADEITTFIGMHVMMGIIKLPSYRMYWADATDYPIISNAMTRNRFDKLRRYIHFNNNLNFVPKGRSGYDKLFKVRPFVDEVLKNFKRVEPEQFHAVDEILIPFKGRCEMKQYIRNKPHKWGIKVFARAGCSGIVYDFKIYTGKDTTAEKTKLGISGDIVIKLCEDLPRNSGFVVAFDNWFSSFSLLKQLKQEGILAIGTVRQNRLQGCKLNSDAELKRKGRGSFDYMVDINSNIIVVKWFDNKSIHVISSFAGIHPIENVQRWSVIEKKRIDVKRPNIIKIYNKYMGGVDLHDMLVELYRINIRSKRFYLRIIFHLIDMCVVNAWLLYRRESVQLQMKYKSLVIFRSEVARSLMVANKPCPRKRGRPTTDSSASSRLLSPKRQRSHAPIDVVRYDKVDHFPDYSDTRKRCKLCIKLYSNIKCTKCNVHLCINKNRNCYTSYHRS